jgi:FtsP/CotA-like multicopper oxidase with cupredoxin domain
VFGDWRLAGAGTIVEASAATAENGERVRTHLTVNGLQSLDIPVKANERIRLRVVNAASARVLSIRLDRHRAIVMAIDGEPAEPFEARDSRFALGPGNRIDLFVDATLEAGTTAALMVDDAGAEVPVARLVYDLGTPARAEPRAEFKPLPANPLPERIDFEHALKLDLPLGTSGSGAALFTVKLGRAVMLGLVNRTAASYAMHLHGHHFRLLDRLDDGWKPFWLDTLVVPAGQTMRIAFVADNVGKWLIQGSALEQRAPPTAQWFEVG